MSLYFAIDMRPLWPEAKTTESLSVHAERAFALIPDVRDRAAVNRYHFVRDAKLSLGSALLKRLGIAVLLRLAWQDVGPVVSRPDVNHGKPYYEPGGVAFNVSHQDGVVILGAMKEDEEVEGEPKRKFEVGVDIVSPFERRERDLEVIREEGWAGFIGMHAEAFAPSEMEYLRRWGEDPVDNKETSDDVTDGGSSKDNGKAKKEGQNDTKKGEGKDEGNSSKDGDNTKTGAKESDAAIEEKLLAFYTLWCLREAWVKMTGAALGASWLRELEFRTFRPPRSRPDPETGQYENITQHELDIWLRGRKVPATEVCVRMRAFETGHIVCVAARVMESNPKKIYAVDDIELGHWRWLQMDELLAYAEGGTDLVLD